MTREKHRVGGVAGWLAGWRGGFREVAIVPQGTHTRATDETQSETVHQSTVAAIAKQSMHVEPC